MSFPASPGVPHSLPPGALWFLDTYLGTPPLHPCTPAWSEAARRTLPIQQSEACHVFCHDDAPQEKDQHRSDTATPLPSAIATAMASSSDVLPPEFLQRAQQGGIVVTGRPSFPPGARSSHPVLAAGAFLANTTLRRNP